MASWAGRRRHARIAVITLITLSAGVLLVTACGSGSAGQSTPVQRAYTRAIDRNLLSVVQIDAGKSTGSGVMFDTKGDIVTNTHVVYGAKHYKVLISAAAHPLAARLIGSFAPDDLAVIRLTSNVADLQIIGNGRVVKSGRASLEVTGTTHATQRGNADGVAIDATRPGGAAAAAGIKTGDIVTRLGGIKTRTLADLDDRLLGYRPGDRVHVDVLRDGKHKQFVVKLGSLSSDP